jgi:NAD(P)-dependent dehydrogenase (short-subunit alcohol dehydrogenase family)
MTTPLRHLVTGAHRPLGAALVRHLLAAGHVAAVTVPNPRRVPALDDLRDEHPGRLHVLAWESTEGSGRTRVVQQVRAALGGIERAIVAELPLPPANDDLADDLRPALLALDAAPLVQATATLVTATLHAVQVAATLLHDVRDARVLLLASWLGSATTKIRGGEHLAAVPHAAQLMLARTLQHDLLSGGIATVVANPGRYRIDPAGLAFQADAETVAAALLERLDAAIASDEPAFMDWRGVVRSW